MPLPYFDQIATDATRQQTGGVLSDAKNFLSRAGMNLPNTPADILNAAMKNINAVIQPKENQANVNYSIPVKSLPAPTNRAEQFADVTMQGLVPAVAQFAVALPIAEAAIPEASTVAGEMLRQALAQGIVSAATSASEGKDTALEQGLIGAGLGVTSAIPRLARLPLNAAILGGVAQEQVNQGADPTMAYGQAGGMLFGSMLPKAIKPTNEFASLQKPSLPESGLPPVGENPVPSPSVLRGPRIDADGKLLSPDPQKEFKHREDLPFVVQPLVDQSGLVHTGDVFHDALNKAPNSGGLLNNQLKLQEQWPTNSPAGIAARQESIVPPSAEELLNQPKGKARSAKTSAKNMQKAWANDISQVAQQHGLTYNGVQDYTTVGGDQYHLFTDPQNGSTFSVPVGEPMSSVQQRLAENRLKFASLQTPEDLVAKLRDVHSSLASHPAVPAEAQLHAQQHVDYLDSLTKEGSKISPEDVGKINTILTETHGMMKGLAEHYDAAQMANPFEKQRAALRDVGGVEIPEHPMTPAVIAKDGTIFRDMWGHSAAMERAAEAGYDTNAFDPDIFKHKGFITDRGRFVDIQEANDLSQRAGQTPKNREKTGLTTEDITQVPVQSAKVYHVTKTEYVNKIKKEGIKPLQKSNWIQSGNGKRYGEGQVHVFTDIHDAVSWAHRMDWEQNEEMGTGKVSILELNKGDAWEKDPTIDPTFTSKGEMLRSLKHIPASDITNSIQVKEQFLPINRPNFKEPITAKEAFPDSKSAVEQVKPLAKKPKFDKLSELKLKANGNMSGAIQLRTGLALGGAAGGALVGYSESKGDWEAALGGALVGAVALSLGPAVVEKLLRNSPEALKNAKEPIKALPKAESASLQKAGAFSGKVQATILNLAFQDHNSGRGGLLAKAANVLLTKFGFGSPEMLRTMKMLARFPVDTLSRTMIVAQEKLANVLATPELKGRINAYVNGRLVPEATVKGIIAAEGGLHSGDPFWVGASKETKKNLTTTWQLGDPAEPEIFHVSPATRAKLVQMENEALFAGLQKTSDIEYAKWAQIARFSNNTMQEWVARAFGGDTRLAQQFIRSMDQHVTRGFKFFTDPRYLPSDADITAMAKETGVNRQQKLVDEAMANSRAYHMEDQTVETPIVKDGVPVGTEKSKTSGYNSLFKRYADNENYDLLSRLREMVPIEHNGETVMVHPDVKQAYGDAGVLERNLAVVKQYLYQQRSDSNMSHYASVQGMDTTLIKSRKDIGPAWRKGLGEFDDPIERMNYAVSRIAPMAKAANFIYEASQADIHGLKGVMTEHEWVTKVQELTNRVTDAKQAGDKELFASLQKQLNELHAYKQGNTDIEFGLLKDHWVNPFIYEQFKSYNALTKDSTSPMGFYITEVNRNFKKFHTAYNNVGMARNYMQTIPLVLAAKGNLMDLPAVWKILHDTSHPLYHDYQNVSSATFANAELGFKLHDMVSGKYDSDFVQMLRKIDRGVLNAYNLPDALGRGMVYMNALRAASKNLKLPDSHPSVKATALEHTNKFYLNFDGVAPAVRWARNVPFFSLYVGWTSEITRIAKNHVQAAMKGDIHSMASLAAIVAIPEMLQFASEQSLSESDRREWEQVKAGLPTYAKDRFYMNIHKDENGNFKFTDFTSLMVDDSYAMLSRAIKRGDAKAFLENNPIIGWNNTPAFTLAAEQIAGKNLHTYQDFRDGNIGDRLTAAIQVISPPLTPYFGYEWNKVMSIGITNQSSGKTETVEGWLTRWSTGANIGTYNPSVIQRRLAQDASAKMDLEAQYLGKVLKTTAPEATKTRAYEVYQEAVKCILAAYQAKVNAGQKQ